MGDKAGAGGVAAGEEAAPYVGIGPEGFAAFGVEYGEVRSADGCRFVIVGDGVFIDVARCVDGAGLASRVNDVAAFGRRGGEQKNEVGLSFVGDDLETSPSLEFFECGFSYCGSAGTVFEKNGFCGGDFGRDFRRRRFNGFRLLL